MSPEDQSAQQFCQESYQALRRGNRRAAQLLAEEAIKLDSNLEDPYFILAALSDPKSSLGYLQRALEINPSSETARQGMHWAVKRYRLSQTQSNSQATAETSLPKLETVQVSQASLNENIAGIPSTPSKATTVVEKKPPSTFSRVAKYTIVKAVTLFLTVVVGLYLTILVVNLGGFVDKIFSANIDESIGMMVYGGWLKDVPEPERTEQIEQTRWAMQEAAGLHSPFIVRSVRWLINSLKLDLGNTYTPFFYTSQEGPIRNIVLSRIPYTLVIVGLGNFLVFFGSIFTALYLSRNHGSLLDRISVIMAPLTSAPSWIIGMVLIFIFAGWLRILPFPKVFGAVPPEYSIKYFSILGKHMILPIMAVVVGAFFSGVYTWRSFFLIYANEDYVEIARAKGLPSKMIERGYILRPVLPYVITSFATMTILIWQSAIALEVLFHWPGVGTLFMQSIRSFDTAMILGIVVIFAYLLAITVFILEIVYALVDPRVRLGSEGVTVKEKSVKLKDEPKTHRTIISKKKSFPITGIQGSLHRRSNPRFNLAAWFKSLRGKIQSFSASLRELASYPSAVIGLTVIGVLICLAIFTLIKYPYHEAVILWRGQTGDWYQNTWYQNPAYAAPSWVNFFRRNKLPENIVMDSEDGSVTKEFRVASENMNEITIPFTFNFPYDDFPQDIILYLSAEYDEKPPLMTFTWQTPDGRVIDLGSQTVKGFNAYYLSRDERLQRKLKVTKVTEALLGDPNATTPTPLKGEYQLTIQGYTFEPDADIDAEVVLYGRVYGLAGTDNQRRDLTIGLLWGIPVALAFGILGAIGTSLVAMLIAAFGVWYGGWVDDLVQRINDVSMILPTLPIVIMVYLLYSKSIWVILGVVVLLNIFGSAIKNYRAAFIQVKNSPYIEAAQTYGVSNWHIIRTYLVPSILPVLIPQMVIMVPVFVFYEATLGFLGVIDPYIPTWGKTIFEAITNGDLALYPYWFLEPIVLLMITALGFALLGIALERILYPKLRRV